MCDSASNSTLMNEAARKELGAKGSIGKIKFLGIGNKESVFEFSHKLNLEIKGTCKNAERKRLENVQTIPNVGIPAQTLDVDELKRQYPYLAPAKIKSYYEAKPVILIGTDNYHIMDVITKIRGPEETDPIAVKCSLGWSVGGRIGGGKSSPSPSCFAVISSENEISNEELHDNMKKFFALENMGVKKDPNNGISIEDKRALEIMENTAKFNGERWEIGMLWRKDEVSFPPSYETALTRLKGIEKRMKKDDSFGELYCAKIEEYLKKGFVRKLSAGEAAVETDKTRYLPHFGVTNPNKPGIRLVFDAAAKANGVSMNDELLKGPDLNRPLLDVLMGFRRHEVALMGDISDMFHCVEVKEDDRQSQRFLWRDGDISKKPETYEVTRLIFGATCSPTQAIYIKNKNAERFNEIHPDAVNAIKNSMYVDDFLGGASTAAATIQLQQQITTICASGGFPIRKWISNSAEVIREIPKEIRAEGVKEFNFDNAVFPVERALGVSWDPADDTFNYKISFHKVRKDILEGARPTKRQVTSLVMSMYDPLGFIANVKVKGLMLIQRCWNAATNWDETVDDEVYGLWKSFLSELHIIEEVKVQRHYGLNNSTKAEMHTFVDASKEGYGAIVYLRVNKGSDVTLMIVQAKARVAPIRKTTIPKLELQAALLGARLALNVKKEIGMWIARETYWSDSNVVLGWLRTSSRRLKEFVANRVSEIQETTNVADWKWIPTGKNVADMATRLEKKISSEEMRLWIKGPEFLLGEEEVSFAEQGQRSDGSGSGSSISEGCGLEPGPGEEGESTVSYAVVAAAQEQKVLVDVGTLRGEKFQSFHRLVRAKAAAIAIGKKWLETARQNLGMRRLRSQVGKEKIPLFPDLKWKATRVLGKQFQILDGKIPIPDNIMAAAETAIYRAVQQEAFGEDLKLLEKGKPARELGKLSPFLDKEGIARVRSRIVKAEVSDSTKYPIILPKKNLITSLIVSKAHIENKHVGRETILNNLRLKYWICNARAEVKRAERNCMLCLIRKAKPQIPEMAPLPESRLSEGGSPFTHTGVDLFGPIEVVVKRSREKRWGILWTCMVTRAIHVDLVGDMSTDEFISALTRFSSWIRKPTFLYSDNGRNFRGAKELQQNLKQWQSQTAEALQTKGIKWQFQPPYAPHMAGVWERLVKSVKEVLGVILKEHHPTERTLLTAVAEISYILNNRPITFVSNDKDDEEALTPNHFLRGGLDASSYGGTVPGIFEAGDEYGKKQWRRAQMLAQHFWNRWRMEYLPTIMLREKWRKGVEPIRVVEAVVLLEKHEIRNSWKIGRVVAVFPDEEGKVRTLTVKVNGKDYTRPVAKVCPIRCEPLGNSGDPELGGDDVSANRKKGQTNREEEEKEKMKRKRKEVERNTVEFNMICSAKTP